MKKIILAAFIIVAVLVAGVLIIPQLGGMGHKSITSEQSQENFSDYASEYKSAAEDNGWEFSSSEAGDIENNGDFSQYYTLQKDGVKINVIMTNSSGYETVTVRCAATYSGESKTEIDSSIYSFMTELYNITGAVELDSEDVSEFVADAANEGEDETETVKKCGDFPTEMIYEADDGCVKLTGITKYCKD